VSLGKYSMSQTKSQYDVSLIRCVVDSIKSFSVVMSRSRKLVLQPRDQTITALFHQAFDATFMTREYC